MEVGDTVYVVLERAGVDTRVASGQIIAIGPFSRAVSRAGAHYARVLISGVGERIFQHTAVFSDSAAAHSAEVEILRRRIYRMEAGIREDQARLNKVRTRLRKKETKLAEATLNAWSKE